MTPTDIFEGERRRLIRLAYRMLGSLAEAEDAVQDAWLRWSAVDPAGIDAPQAWLVRVITRLCLDRLKSARARRETYVGPWLPEPLVEEVTADPLERAEDISVAFLLALQRLSPLERAVFLLHDVFDQDYAAVADSLGRSEPACRQLAARARQHVRDARPRFQVSEEEAGRLAGAFLQAAASNDMSAIASLLTEDAVLISDGGGKRKAALRPMIGREDVLTLLRGLAWRHERWADLETARVVRINGLPGLVLQMDDGPATLSLEASGDGRISAIYIVRNPEKLSRINR
ncbi:sigma-70 family RNA polymerase sigma factor [Caulobacter sp. KR2-114]|uniref:sigma-70 family RNA polymerase sigma factor n=1 Tax=Caulobacter sp. KR2-114 TaxID=3400912 RepID=UPI003C0FA8F2